MLRPHGTICVVFHASHNQTGKPSSEQRSHNIAFSPLSEAKTIQKYLFLEITIFSTIRRCAPGAPIRYTEAEKYSAPLAAWKIHRLNTRVAYAVLSR